LKENGFLDHILAENNKINRNEKEVRFSSNHDGATRLLVPCTIYIIAEYQTKIVKKRLSHNMRGSFNVVGTLASLLSVLLLSVDGLPLPR
jgi:hypothetical protein